MDVASSRTRRGTVATRIRSADRFGVENPFHRTFALSPAPSLPTPPSRRVPAASAEVDGTRAGGQGQCVSRDGKSFTLSGWVSRPPGPAPAPPLDRHGTRRGTARRGVARGRKRRVHLQMAFVWPSSARLPDGICHLGQYRGNHSPGSVVGTF